MIKSPIIVSIEGNIAAGKTTIFQALSSSRETLGWKFVGEPVGEWTDAYATGINALGDFYKDQKGQAFTIQMLILETQITHLETAISSGAKVIITDRSIDTAKECFAKLLAEEEKLSIVQWRIYERLFERLALQLPRTSGIVYVSTPPDVCFERLHKRARKEEVETSLELRDYLKRLDEKHRVWMNGVRDTFPVFDVEHNVDFTTSTPEGDALMKKIISFIEGL